MEEASFVMSILRVVVRFVLALSTLVIAAVSPAAADLVSHSSHASHDVDRYADLVEHVRQATRSLRTTREATDAGYEQFLGCVSSPYEGAMGVHFVNTRLVDDGEVDAGRPEALIYELKHGVMRLVGVEYIVMADAWQSRPRETPVPVLEGQAFQFNGSPNRFGLPAFYELHVWAWRDNPHGAFVDWNPRVSCEGR